MGEAPHLLEGSPAGAFEFDARVVRPGTERPVAITKAQQILAGRLRKQAHWCRELGSPFYGILLEHAAADVEAGGPVGAILQGHEGDPAGSALGLRLLGAVHRRVLEGRAPTLAPYYPSAGGDARAGDAWPAFRETVTEQREAVRHLLERPVQTNEVGRSAALLGGFLLVARSTGLPLRLLEIGASAGLNLRWDQYFYESGAACWGDPGSPVRFADVFVDARPAFDVVSTVSERAGCDRSPLDPRSEDDRLTPLSYVWPDQTGRIARLRGALEVACRVPATVEAAEAPEWLATRLDSPSAGVATVVFHSIVMPYLSEASRGQIRHLLLNAGRRATVAAPLAWLRMEAGAEQADVRLTLWPGGDERLLATAGYHGHPIRWLAE